MKRKGLLLGHDSINALATGDIAYVDRKFATHICLAEGSLGQVTPPPPKKTGITRPRPHGGVKSPRGIRPRHCCLSPWGVKYVTVT